jgi:serine/threonine protein kinase
MQDQKARADCIKEIDLLRSLDHVNVVRIFESFIEGDELIIVLEIADAGDLQKMIKHFKSQGRSIPERTIWYVYSSMITERKYFYQISSGLQHCHNRRIMHRDIKPANVFLTAQGKPPRKHPLTFKVLQS